MLSRKYCFLFPLASHHEILFCFPLASYHEILFFYWSDFFFILILSLAFSKYLHFSSLSLGITFLLHLFNEILFLTGRKEAKERHFWQYNVQAKGPKGARVSIEPGVCDPHQYVDVKDPVFSSSALSVQGIKHR